MQKCGVDMRDSLSNAPQVECIVNFGAMLIEWICGSTWAGSTGSFGNRQRRLLLLSAEMMFMFFPTRSSGSAGARRDRVRVVLPAIPSRPLGHRQDQLARLDTLKFRLSLAVPTAKGQPPHPLQLGPCSLCRPVDHSAKWLRANGRYPSCRLFVVQLVDVLPADHLLTTCPFGDVCWAAASNGVKTTQRQPCAVGQVNKRRRKLVPVSWAFLGGGFGKLGSRTAHHRAECRREPALRPSRGHTTVDPTGVQRRLARPTW
ncbi:hypothetical protein IWX50DRAFT_613513 [Phyllosticta citricarpa]|uniref:Uncharacterized protein n=1 Tax=Phyllosticta citricarpa TaxID=55181 RepID=A0ABR1M700_9PEZI